MLGRCLFAPGPGKAGPAWVLLIALLSRGVRLCGWGVREEGFSRADLACLGWAGVAGGAAALINGDRTGMGRAGAATGGGVGHA